MYQVLLSLIFLLAGFAHARPSFGSIESQEFLCNKGDCCKPLQDACCELQSGEWICENDLVKRAGEVTKPGCAAHLDHYDCDDGGFCEQEDGNWWCFDSAGVRQNADGSAIAGNEESEAADTSSAGSCVVHGGHTHGDCGDVCDGIDTGEYDLDLHIAAIFILLVASALGVGFPMILSSKLGNSFYDMFFFVTRHFGSGIIISVAFVHLLYHGLVMFANECIGHLAFEPAAPTIAIAGVLLTFLIDFIAMRYISRKPQQQQHSPTSSASSSDSDKQDAESQLLKVAQYSSEQARFDVYLLDAGIVFHSIMIGVSLGATGGASWIPLLCAIAFHQFFEGLALGSRIALLVFKRKSKIRKLIMALPFALVTPIGIAIGVSVHQVYNVNGRAGLLASGILDSLSAGILLYAGLVELLAHEWLHGDLARAPLSRVLIGLASLLSGMGAMTLIGKWA